MGSALPLGVEVADVLGEVAAVGVAVVEPVSEERCCLVKVSVRDTVAVEEAEGEGVEEALCERETLGLGEGVGLRCSGVGECTGEALLAALRVAWRQ